MPEFDVPVPGIPGIGNFSYFWWYRNRYRKKLVPEKSLGTGIGKIWYRKKVSEPVSEKFSTGKDFRRQNFGILKIYNGYRYRIGINSYTTEFIYMLYQCSSPKFFRCWRSQQFHRCWLAKSFPFPSLTNLHQKSLHTLQYMKIYICPNICLGYIFFKLMRYSLFC